MSSLYRLWNSADELHNDGYGEKFIELLEQHLNYNDISKKDAESLIKCLIDADEIRDIFPKEIMSLISRALETGFPIPELIWFFNQSCAQFTTDVSHDEFKNRFDSMLEHINGNAIDKGL